MVGTDGARLAPAPAPAPDPFAPHLFDLEPRGRVLAVLLGRVPRRRRALGPGLGALECDDAADAWRAGGGREVVGAEAAGARGAAARAARVRPCARPRGAHWTPPRPRGAALGAPRGGPRCAGAGGRRPRARRRPPATPGHLHPPRRPVRRANTTRTFLLGHAGHLAPDRRGRRRRPRGGRRADDGGRHAAPQEGGRQGGRHGCRSAGPGSGEGRRAAPAHTVPICGPAHRGARSAPRSTCPNCACGTRAAR